MEAELGFTSKDDIERFGIAEFNARCREKVLSHVEDWKALCERIGHWVDLDDSYHTLDSHYVESVWWALKTIHDKGLLFEKLKVVPYCPRCGTALSSHELGQPGVYQDDTDLSAYVRLPVTTPAGPLHARRPARRVDDDPVDARLQRGRRDRPGDDVCPRAAGRRCRPRRLGARRGCGPRRRAQACSSGCSGRPLRSCGSSPAAEIVGTRYEPPFPFIAFEEYGPDGHSVLPADFVTDEEGTGLVHTAIAFGEDDFRLGEQFGLAVINPVALDGTYDERIGPWAGRSVNDVDADLVEDLRERGKLLRAEPYEHSYPHCWRCNTPLIYYAKPSWYVGTSQMQDRLLAANETIGWYPDRVKHGRFGKWLEGNVDWALSRERYWGTPLPVWRCENDHIHVIGSFDELHELSGVLLEDPAPPVRRRGDVPVRRVRVRRCAAWRRRDRRVVRLGLDAVCAVRTRRRTAPPSSRSTSRPISSARRSIRRGAGSTRCWRSRRCCSTAPPTGTSSASG